MKLFFQRIHTHPLFAKTYGWVKLISYTSAAQITVQALGLVSGILIIRILSPAEYALYTLANTMVATMTLLADGGISAGVMAQGAKHWDNPNKLGTVFSTGYNLRKKFAIGSLLVAMPILIYLLNYHGASWIMAFIITLALVPAFITNLSNQLLVIIPKLNQDIYPLQKIEIGVNIARLAFLMLFVFVFPFAFIAVLAAGIPQIWGNKKLFKLSSRYADLKQEQDQVIQKEIYTFVKRMMPGVIYYCLAGNLTIWIASLLSSTNVIAQLGALGRLAIILTVSHVLFNTLITPRFAKMVASSKILLKKYAQINVGLFCFSILTIGAVWLFSNQILWVLGPDYANLNLEVVLVVVASCINFIGTASFSLYISKGWVIKPLISIPIQISSIIIGIFLIDISTIQGILSLNIFIAMVNAIMHITFSIIKIGKSKLTESINLN
ncbi:MAG: lipopolysaccharide biosynthesis protein [Flavobacteriales bacterium]